MHPPLEKGIYGDKDGARSIVMSGKYKDDKDEGDTMCGASCVGIPHGLLTGGRCADTTRAKVAGTPKGYVSSHWHWEVKTRSDDALH